MKKVIYIVIAILMMVSCSQKIGYNSVDAGKFATIIQNTNKIQIVDVRTPDEFSEGHLPGAVNIDVNGTDFAEQIKKLDKKVPVAVYCRSGRRSKLAADQLVNSGYTVTELDGGIISWQGEIEK